MNISVSDRYHAAVVHLKGKFLGSMHGDDFKDTLAELRAQGKKHVVLDLSAVAFLDSTGVGALIAGLASMRRDGGDIRIAGLEHRARDLFLMTRLLGPVFDEYPTIEEAEGSFFRNGH
jgi:anti-sigma B factor antagonist